MKSKILDTLLDLLANPLKLSACIGALAALCLAAFFGLRWALKRRGLLHTYSRVLRYVWHYKLFFALTLLFSFAFAGFSGGRLILGEPFINQFVQKPAWEIALPLVISLLVLSVGMSIASFLRTYFHQYILGRTYVDLRCDAANNLLDLSLDFYDRRKAGDLLSRLTNDILVAQKSVDFMLGDIIEKPALILVGMTLIFLTSWQVGLIILVALPVLVLPVRTIGKSIRKHSRKSLKRQAEATQTINQAFTGIRIVKAFNTEDVEKQAFRRENEGYFRKFMRVVRGKAASNSFTSLASNGGAAVLVLLCCYILIRQLWGLNAGSIVVIAGTAAFMHAPIRSLVKAYNKLQESMAGASRVFELIDLRPTIKDAPGAKPLPPFQRDIVFSHVDFSYDEEPVLRDIDLTVKAGEMVAVVGPSGAGKTTLLNLIPRFYDAQNGSVKIDGHDVKGATSRSLLSQIAIVGQVPFLFHSSIRDNILYGQRNATEEDIIAAAKAANAHEFIVNELENGYDTVVGEQGVRLSGGQRQRITIARAILKNARILILDEATSSLDSESEMLVQEALNRLMENRTTFVIAHRLTTVMHADKIVVLDGGKMMGVGAHDELVKTCPTYKKLYSSQFRHTSTRRFTL